MSISTSIEKMQNPSIVLYGAKKAQLEDKPIPKIIDPHDVLIRIAYVGVCGSDVSPYRLSLYDSPSHHTRSTSGITVA